MRYLLVVVVVALLPLAAVGLQRQPPHPTQPTWRPPQMEHGCAPPCHCSPMSLSAVFNMILFIREVVMNCTAANLTELPGPVYFEVYALLLPHNNLTELGAHCFSADMQVSDMRELDLRDNSISSVHPEALRGLHALTTVALDRNRITSLPPELFADCPGIEYLSLSGNPLLLPSTTPFLFAPSLSVLDISKCNIRSIPEETFSEMTLLRVLYLADNPDLGQVNVSTLANLPHLQGLTVMRNAHMTLTGVGTLPVQQLEASGACQLLQTDVAFPKLNKLSVQGCALSSLPPVVRHNLHGIDMLLLGRNAFSTWDSSNKLDELSGLALDLNNITRLEKTAFINAPMLGILNLSGNALQVPEKGPLLISDSLHSLDLYNCSLGRLPEDALVKLPKLGAIDLSLNSLRELPAKLFSELPDLQLVLMSDNGLKSLPEDLFANNHQLRQLHLSGNPLLLSGENPVLPSAPSVALLELDRMEITTLQAVWFNSMPQVTNLSLENNQLTTIKLSSIQNLKNLKEIILTGNKLECNAALLPFFDWTKENSVNVIAKCSQPRGNWQLMEHLHFEEEEEREHEHYLPTTSTPTTTKRLPTTITIVPKTKSAATVMSRTTVRLEPEVISSPMDLGESSKKAIQAASVGGSIGSNNNGSSSNTSSGNGSLWVVLLVGVLVGGIAGAVLTAVLARRISCPSRASNFLPIRLRDTAAIAEDYGDDERLGS